MSHREVTAAWHGDDMTDRTSTAFVLSGGANLGAVQVGMLRALMERGIVPELVIGSSVGAVNAAWLAGTPGLAGVERLATIWRSIKRQHVFPLSPFAGALGFLGRQNHLVPADGLERLLRRHLPFARIEEARIPLHIVATEVTTGAEVLLSGGDVVQAVLASAAIPGVFPPVRVEGVDLMDGGVVDNTPVSHAVALGATSVYVLPTGYACSLGEAPHTALAMGLQALNLLINQRLATDIERFEGLIELHVIPPLCPLSLSPVDFSRSTDLMRRARTSTHEWLDHAPPLRGQSRLVALHRHDRPPPTTKVAPEPAHPQVAPPPRLRR
jgi:NTE family protein